MIVLYLLVYGVRISAFHSVPRISPYVGAPLVCIERAIRFNNGFNLEAIECTWHCQREHTSGLRYAVTWGLAFQTH